MGQYASRVLFQEGEVLEEETFQENYFFTEIYIKQKDYLNQYIKEVLNYYKDFEQEKDSLKSGTIQKDFFIDDVYRKLKSFLCVKVQDRLYQLNSSLGNQQDLLGNDQGSDQTLNQDKQIKELIKFFYGQKEAYIPDYHQYEQHNCNIFTKTLKVIKDFSKIRDIGQNDSSFKQFLLFQSKPDQVIRQIKLKHLLLNYMFLPFRFVMSTLCIIFCTFFYYIYKLIQFMICSNSKQIKDDSDDYIKVNPPLQYSCWCIKQKNTVRYRNFDKKFNISKIQSPILFYHYIRFWILICILCGYIFLKKMFPNSDPQEGNMKLIVCFIISQEILFLLLDVLSRCSNTNVNFETSYQDKIQQLERMEISDEDLQIEFMRKPLELEIVLQIKFHYLSKNQKQFKRQVKLLEKRLNKNDSQNLDIQIKKNSLQYQNFSIYQNIKTQKNNTATTKEKQIGEKNEIFEEDVKETQQNKFHEENGQDKINEENEQNKSKQENEQNKCNQENQSIYLSQNDEKKDQNRFFFDGMSIFYSYIFQPQESGLSQKTIGVDLDYLELYEKRLKQDNRLVFDDIGQKGYKFSFYSCIVFILLFQTVLDVILEQYKIDFLNKLPQNIFRQYCNLFIIFAFQFEGVPIQILKSFRNSLKRLTSIIIYDRSNTNRQKYKNIAFELPCINLFCIQSINCWYNMRKLIFQQEIVNQNIIMLHSLLEFSTGITVIYLFWPNLYSFYMVSKCEGLSISQTNIIALIILFYKIIYKSLYKVISYFCEINSSYSQHLQILKDIYQNLKQTQSRYEMLPSLFQNKLENEVKITYFQYEAFTQIKNILKSQPQSNQKIEQKNQFMNSLSQNDLLQSSNLIQEDENQSIYQELIDQQNLESQQLKFKNDLLRNSQDLVILNHQQNKQKNQQLISKEEMQQHKEYLEKLILQYDIIINDLQNHESESQLYFLGILPINDKQKQVVVISLAPFIVTFIIKIFKKWDFYYIFNYFEEIWKQSKLQ